MHVCVWYVPIHESPSLGERSRSAGRVSRAGAVFAVQVSYLVTLFGLCWAMLFLGEAYTGWVWAALLVLFSGMALVQPRPRSTLARPLTPRQNAPG